MDSPTHSRFTKLRCNLSFCRNYITQCSFTSLDAIRHFAIISEALYPQYLTWNRSPWRAQPTRKRKLVPWYFLSFLIAMSASCSVYIATREIFRFQKDPEISVYTGIVGLMQICINSFNVFQAITMISTVHDYCFILNHVYKMRGRGCDDNGKWGKIFAFHC